VGGAGARPLDTPPTAQVRRLRLQDHIIMGGGFAVKNLIPTSRYPQSWLWCSSEEEWLHITDAVIRGRAAYCPSCGSRLRVKPRSGNTGAAGGKEKVEEYVIVPRSLLLEVYRRLDEIQRKFGGDTQ